MTDVVSHSSRGPAEALDFADFYREHHAVLIRRLRHTFGDLTEEIVQDAFLVALEKWESVASMQAPDAWVWVVARRIAWRRLGREIERPTRESRTTWPLATAPIEPDTDLRQAVDSLPEHQRQAIVLHHFLDTPVGELAEALGCSTGTAKVWLHRARSRLGPISAGLEGRWSGKRRWTTDDVVGRVREIGADRHLQTLLEDFPALRLRRTIRFWNGRYEIGASDGRWLDGGRYSLHSGRLTLNPVTVPGVVVLNADVDGDEIAFRYESHTTPKWHGVSDRTAMAMLLEAETFDWVGKPQQL